MMDLAFTADGSNIVYREHSYDKNSRRLVAVKSYDIAKASNRVISAPSHRLEAVDVRGVSALTVDNGRAKVVRAAVTPAAVEIYAPVWYDNNTVVGMKTKDDGRVTYEGRIVASNAEGTVFQTLTDDSLIAVLPSAAPGRIAFTTTDGKAYILNIKK